MFFYLINIFLFKYINYCYKFPELVFLIEPLGDLSSLVQSISHNAFLHFLICQLAINAPTALTMETTIAPIVAGSAIYNIILHFYFFSSFGFSCCIVSFSFVTCKYIVELVPMLSATSFVTGFNILTLIDDKGSGCPLC